jgi:hypothetical protein
VGTGRLCFAAPTRYRFASPGHPKTADLNNSEEKRKEKQKDVHVVFITWQLGIHRKSLEEADKDDVNGW